MTAQPASLLAARRGKLLLLGGLAVDASMLVSVRLGQGAGAAMMTPAGQASLTRPSPPKRSAASSRRTRRSRLHRHSANL